MKKIYFTLIILLSLITTAACSSPAPESNAPQKLNVVATTGQIADTTRNIGGEAINLTGMFGPGIDPHLYVPTEGDVSLLAQADIILYNGLHLEARMSRALEQMTQQGITVLAVGETLPEESLISWDDNYPHDPHVWNDPQLWRHGVEAIRDTLIEADPANADHYRENTAAYLTEIEATHAYIQQQVARIPAEQRVMITAHDAFVYFGRAYSFEVHGLQGISTESEASTDDMQQLADFIVSRQIPAIFVETTVSSRNIEAVQEAVRARDFEVVIGGQLYSDALGDPDTLPGTYLGMLRHNVDTLAEALGETVQAQN